MPRLATHVAVEHSDRSHSGPRRVELRGEVLRHGLLREADAMHRGNHVAVANNFMCVNVLATEPVREFRPFEGVTPPAERVVVAEGNEGTNAMLGETIETVTEPELGPEAAVLAVEDVAGYDHEIDLFPDGEGDDVVV